jgi:ribonucleoside-diphosphate reductase subunit M2
MNSPIKKINFEAVGKENIPVNADAPIDPINTPGYAKPLLLPGVNLEVAKKAEVVEVAPTIKPEEADEPLLQANSQRFVLFPIKYHEVSRVLRWSYA